MRSLILFAGLFTLNVLAAPQASAGRRRPPKPLPLVTIETYHRDLPRSLIDGVRWQPQYEGGVGFIGHPTGPLGNRVTLQVYRYEDAKRWPIRFGINIGLLATDEAELTALFDLAHRLRRDAGGGGLLIRSHRAAGGGTEVTLVFPIMRPVMSPNFHFGYALAETLIRAEAAAGCEPALVNRRLPPEIRAFVSDYFALLRGESAEPLPERQ